MDTPNITNLLYFHPHIVRFESTRGRDDERHHNMPFAPRARPVALSAARPAPQPSAASVIRAVMEDRQRLQEHDRMDDDGAPARTWRVSGGQPTGPRAERC